MEELRQRVAAEIDLFEQANPQVTSNINNIWAFGGSGTVFVPYLPEDLPYHPWSDQRRISRAALLAHQVTALRLDKPVQEVVPAEVYFRGPRVIYTGRPKRAEAFRTLLSLPSSPLVSGSVLIIDSITITDDAASKRPIINTPDDVLSFPANLPGGNSGTLALVSSAPHLPRILRYLKKYRPIPDEVAVRCFPIPSDPEWTERFAQEEINRVIKYLSKGHLAKDPYPTDLGISRMA